MTFQPYVGAGVGPHAQLEMASHRYNQPCDGEAREDVTEEC